MVGRSIAALVHVKAGFGDFAIGVRASSIVRAAFHNRKARLEACEKVIGGGQASGKDLMSGKDLALAYAVRGQAFRVKRNYDKAITAFSQRAGRISEA
jgi:hypothetical protein